MRVVRTLVVIALLASDASGVAAQDDSALDSTRRAKARKSPTTARALGIVPGFGHFYAGEIGHGFAYLVAPAGVLAGGSLLIVLECVGDVASTTDDTCPSPILENAVVLAVFAVWGWSIYDAGRAAHRTNARRELSATPFVRPQRMPGAMGPTGKLAVGIAFRGW